jgi:hypothetical protein
MSLDEIAETLREDVAQTLVDALNDEAAESLSEEEIARAARAISRRVEAVAPDAAAQADLQRRIGYRPACFQRVSTRRLRDAARELFDAASEARDLLLRRGLPEERATLARLEQAIEKTGRS